MMNAEEAKKISKDVIEKILEHTILAACTAGKRDTYFITDDVMVLTIADQILEENGYLVIIESSTMLSIHW